MYKLKIAKLTENATLPTKGSASAAGLDLYSTADYSMKPGGRQLIPLDLMMEIPEGNYGRIAPRSGLAVKAGLDVMAGVIDSDYRGNVQVLLINLNNNIVNIKKGDRIAQLILEAYTPAEPLEVSLESLSNTKRGEGGFGSS